MTRRDKINDAIAMVFVLIVGPACAVGAAIMAGL